MHYILSNSFSSKMKWCVNAGHCSNMIKTPKVIQYTFSQYFLISVLYLWS